MKTTISTHNGSSFSLGHNRRDPKYTSATKHIDLSKKHENWIDIPIREAYTWLFGEAMREYNEKQTREDRKIADYYRKIQADTRKHVAYEMIIAVGSKENPIPQVIGYQIMQEYVQNWSERNPNLYLYGAYYHADEEGVPHVHLDYIPVAHGFKRGMKTQTALTKALEQQGFEHKGNKSTCQIQWERSENQYLEGLCGDYDIKIDHPMAGKGVDHLHYTAYKAKMELEEVQQELDKVKNSLQQGKKEVKRVEKLLSDNSMQVQMTELCIAENDDVIDEQIKRIGSDKKELQALQEKKEQIKGEVQDLEELQGISRKIVSNPKQVKKVPFRDSVVVEGATLEQVQGAFDVVATMQDILVRQRREAEELEEREERLREMRRALKAKEKQLKEREKMLDEEVEQAKQTHEDNLLESFKNVLNSKLRELKEKMQKTIDKLREKLEATQNLNRFYQEKLREHGISAGAYEYTLWDRKNNHPEDEKRRQDYERDEFER